MLHLLVAAFHGTRGLPGKYHSSERGQDDHYQRWCAQSCEYNEADESEAEVAYRFYGTYPDRIVQSGAE